MASFDNVFSPGDGLQDKNKSDCVTLVVKFRKYTNLVSLDLLNKLAYNVL
jgi:hypothetical protein